jgi:UDP-galactopyranose mutase
MTHEGEKLRSLRGYHLVIVGAGFFGLTLAHQISTRSNAKVVVIDKRPHFGGNAYSYRHESTNIEIHKYGSHLFHTSNERVWNFVKNFTGFNSYVHKVKTLHKGQVYSMPINLHTISQHEGRYFSPSEANAWIQAQRNPSFSNAENLEEHAIGLIGKSLYDCFIKGYTQKQWQSDPRLLPADIIKRLPVRFNFDDRYFSDKYEGLPVDGYGNLFNNLFESANFDLILDLEIDSSDLNLKDYGILVWTGAIDRFFNNEFGHLNWRTLDFVEEHHDVEDFQGTSVMNYADIDTPFTRIHEFKHLHPERNQSPNKTIIFKEFSRFAGPDDEPYYPVNSPSDRRTLQFYRKKAESISNLVFGGRLGRYQYLDMHMAIASALNLSDKLLENSPISFLAKKR